MFSKKKLVSAAIVALLLPVLAACGESATPTPAAAPTTAPAAEATATTAPVAEATATTAPSAAGGNAFRWRAFTEPETFDPALMQEFLSIDLAQNLYDGLTQFNPKTLDIEPALAKSWDVSPDGSVYTFHLRDDATFSNGDPVTADDFKYSWNRALNTKEAPYLFVMDDIKGAKDVEASVVSTDTSKPKVTEAAGIEAVDKSTLKVTLNGPSAYFISQTALWTYFVVNKNVVGKCPADKPSCFTETGANLGAGTGAYILDTWDHNNRLSFKVNPKYWGEKATVDVEVPIVKDVTTAQAQYENGQIDALDGPDANDVSRLQNDAKLKDQLFSVGQARSVWIGLNVTKKGSPFGPLDDPKAKMLRQALNMGIDRQQLVDLALQSTAEPLTSLLPKGVPGYKQYDAYPFNAEQAKKLLADSGHANCAGLNLTYTTRDRDAEKKVAEQIQAQMKDNLGCAIQVAVIPWKDMLKARQAHEYDMFYGSWGQDYPDPQDWLYALFDSSQIDVGNDPGYNKPEFDKLVREANAMADPAKLSERMGKYNAAEKMLLDDAVIVPLYQASRFWEFNTKKFTGYGTNAQFIYPFRLVKPAQ